jgi:hypothetical protein
LTVHPLIEQAQAAHRRDLAELLTTHPGQWTAYHGERRLDFGASATQLIQKWVSRGIPRGELWVTRVEPDALDKDPSDVITEEEAARERQIPSQLPTEVPPLIQLAQDAFRRDLPALLTTRYRQWVAYHGDRRLGFGRSKTRLVQEWLARGIPIEEFMVLCVKPSFPYEDDD